MLIYMINRFTFLLLDLGTHCLDIRNSASLSQFKWTFHVRAVKHPSLDDIGRRKRVIHARFRMFRIQLNSHLFQIGGEKTLDYCGQDAEDVWHYFFTCPKNELARNKLHSFFINVVPLHCQTYFLVPLTTVWRIIKLLF